MTNRVAITGMGIVTCYGIGTSATWGKILAGDPGIRPITLFDTTDYRVTRAGEFTDLPVAPWRRFRATRMDRASNLLHHALAGALDGLDMPATATLPVPPMVALGTTLGGMTSGERYHGCISGRARPWRDHPWWWGTSPKRRSSKSWKSSRFRACRASF